MPGGAQYTLDLGFRYPGQAQMLMLDIHPSVKLTLSSLMASLPFENILLGWPGLDRGKIRSASAPHTPPFL